MDHHALTAYIFSPIGVELMGFEGGIRMKCVVVSFTVFVSLILLSPAHGFAQGSSNLAVPGYPVAVDVPGAKELPDPELEYRIAWGIGQGAEDRTTEINPSLPTIARYVNTLAKWGVPEGNRHIVVMFHQRSPDFDIVLSNEAFKAKYGKDNPNIGLISALKKAGVEFRACGQAVVGREIDPKDVNPDIQIDLWAMTSFMNLQMKGFVRTGN
jgi:intracellular sulfur oxidation DsrE/DsrF family protein